MVLGPIYAVRIFVADLDTARHFYDSLGYEQVHASEDFLIYRPGSADLIIERADPGDAEEADLIGRFVGASFAVGDIKQACSTLESLGVAIDSPPERQPWGGMLAHIRDPDGNVLTLVEVPAV